MNTYSMKNALTPELQYHVDKRDLTSFKSLAAVPRGNYWDGIVNITVPELEDLEEVVMPFSQPCLVIWTCAHPGYIRSSLTHLQIFEHADYLKDVVDDEAKFLDREDALLFIGHNEDKKLDGVVQPGVW